MLNEAVPGAARLSSLRVHGRRVAWCSATIYRETKSLRRAKKVVPARAGEGEEGESSFTSVRPSRMTPARVLRGHGAVCATAARCSGENVGRGLGVATRPATARSRPSWRSRPPACRCSGARGSGRTWTRHRACGRASWVLAPGHWDEPCRCGPSGFVRWSGGRTAGSLDSAGTSLISNRSFATLIRCCPFDCRLPAACHAMWPGPL
jgi:hypothetical protein